MKLISNEPNAAKLVFALRNTGYNSYTAILDIIDNSIDAGAKKIDIQISKDSICIIDNGYGMLRDTLDQAIKLGSETDKNDDSDLGKFGMGLCTGSMSIGRKLEVFTKTADFKAEGEDCLSYLYSSQDIDIIEKENSFKKELRGCTRTECELLNKYIEGPTGTVVLITKIDNISNGNLTAFSNKLSKDIGQVFRKFIDAGIVFTVNEKKVETIDPFRVKGTSIEFEETLKYKIFDDIEVKLVLLPTHADEKNKSIGINQRTQGLYILRNNREISSGGWLGITNTHNDLNRIRVELSFNSALDTEFGVKFNKDGVHFNQSMLDFLKEELLQNIKRLKNKCHKEHMASGDSVISHKESEENIAKKSKLLVIPDADKEKRAKKTSTGSNETKTPTDTKRENYTNKQLGKSTGARYFTANLGKQGSLYECVMNGRQIEITWNAEHPFYERVMLGNKDNKNLTSAIDYLIFGLASAELNNIDEDALAVIDNFKGIMSLNLRNLIV